VKVIVEGVDLLEKVKQLRVKNNKVVREEIKKARVKILRDQEWREVDSIMYKKKRQYISKNNALRAEIIRLYYNIPVRGHKGQ